MVVAFGFSIAQPDNLSGQIRPPVSFIKACGPDLDGASSSQNVYQHHSSLAPKPIANGGAALRELRSRTKLASSAMS
jgi:hypothetical protein